MKLIRFGERGMEKPGVLTDQGHRKDCSALFADWNRDFFQHGGLERLRAWNAKLDELPEVPPAARWGAPVVRPGKVIGIGLNYSDHAAESGMPIPAEPIELSLPMSAISLRQRRFLISCAFTFR